MAALVSAVVAGLATLALASAALADHALRSLSTGFIPGGLIDSWNQHRISSDGEWIAFEGCHASSGPCWIGVANRNDEPGDAPTEVAGPIYTPAGAIAGGIGVSFAAGGSRIVYRAAIVPDGVGELWSAPTDGSAPPVRLHPAFTAGEQLGSFQMTSDGEQVVFAVEDAFGGGELLRAPIDGSAAPTPLDEGAVGGFHRFPASSGSPRVLYFIDADADDRFEMFTLFLHETTPFAPWAGEFREGMRVGRLQITADGARAVLVADLETANVDELWSITLSEPGTFRRLSQPPVNGGDVSTFSLTADGLAVYTADALIDEKNELWSVPIDDSAPPVKLSGTIVGGGDVQSTVQIAGDWVVYLADAAVDDKTELWSAPVDGGASPTRRNLPLAANRDVWGFRTTDFLGRLIYRADGEADGRYDLYRTTVFGITSHVRLTNVDVLEPDPYGVQATFEVAPDGGHVVFGIEADATHDGMLIEQSIVAPLPDPEVLVVAEGVDASSMNPRYTPDSLGISFEVTIGVIDRKEVYLSDLRIFRDGFESGYFAAWSSALP